MCEVVFAAFEVDIDWNTVESLFTDTLHLRELLKVISKLVILVVWKLHSAFHTRSMHNIL